MPLPGIVGIGGLVGAGMQFIGYASADVAAGTSLVISAPANLQNGDLLVAILGGADVDASWTGDTGWTERLDVGTAGDLRVATLTAGSSEPASYTFTASTSVTACGQILCFRNCSYDTIGTAGNGAAGVVTAPGITSAGGIIIGAWASTLSAGASQTYSTPSGMTAIATYNNTANTTAIGTFYQSVAAGATGNRASTIGRSGNTDCILVGIK